MHVPERNRELERERKQREIRTHSRTQPEPAHRRHALRVSPWRNHSATMVENFSYNVTLRTMGRSCDSSAVLPKINIRLPSRSQYRARRGAPRMERKDAETADLRADR